MTGGKRPRHLLKRTDHRLLGGRGASRGVAYQNRPQNKHLEVATLKADGRDEVNHITGHGRAVYARRAPHLVRLHERGLSPASRPTGALSAECRNDAGGFIL